MITEDYVSFEIAKLLKEKGFDEKCIYVYRHDGSEDTWDADKEDIACQKPTLQMAMKWLRKEHNILITIIPQEVNIGVDRMCYAIYRISENLYQPLYNGKVDSLVNPYEESCEAAIKYCLENLI